ncbi:MAG: hypothetical protein AAGC81_18160 [Pseudomonadota bacterium]
MRNLVTNRLATARRQVVDLYETQILHHIGKLSAHSFAFDKVPDLRDVEIGYLAAKDAL